VGQGETRDLQQHDDEAEQGDEPFDASAHSEHFLLKGEHVPFDDIEGDHLGACRG